MGVLVLRNIRPDFNSGIYKLRAEGFTGNKHLAPEDKQMDKRNSSGKSTPPVSQDEQAPEEEKSVPPEYDAGALVLEYTSRIQGIIRGFRVAEEDSGDIFQEISIRIAKNLERFEGRSHIGTWIYRIAVNECKRFLDKKKRDRLDSGAGDIDQFESGPRTTPEFAYEQIELRERIQDALGELSQEYREVIILHSIDGLSYQQISDTLEIPMGTVESRLYRAREKLRRILQGAL